MSPRRPNATQGMKARISASVGDTAVVKSGDKKENAQLPTSNVQRRSQTRTGVDPIVHREIDSVRESRDPGGRIDIGKIGGGLLVASPVPVRLAPRTRRCQQSPSNFCRAC